jgi:hypothetical protein
LYKEKLEDSERTLREFKEANLKDLRYKIPTVLKDSGTGEVQAGSPVGELLGAGAQNSHMAKLEQYQNALTKVEIALKEANLNWYYRRRIYFFLSCGGSQRPTPYANCRGV